MELAYTIEKDGTKVVSIGEWYHVQRIQYYCTNIYETVYNKIKKQSFIYKASYEFNTVQQFETKVHNNSKTVKQNTI